MNCYNLFCDLKSDSGLIIRKSLLINLKVSYQTSFTILKFN